MTAEEVRQKQLVKLKDTLIYWFSNEELEDASFDLGIDYRALGGATKEANVRILIMELSRRGRLTQLLEWCDQHRPEIEWGLFTHLRQNYQTSVVQEPRSGNGVLLTLVGVMFSVIVIGAVAASFFFTRTTQPTPTAAPPILQVPLLETTTIQQPVVQATATNLIVTAIPVGNIEPSQEPTQEPAVSPTPTRPQPVETSTLPSDIVIQDGPPFKLKITDTYRDEPLDKANVRSGPGLGFSVVAQLGANLEITVLAYAYNSAGIPWYLIELGDGRFGWISGVLVELDSVPFERIPPAATVPPTNTPVPTATPTQTPVPSPTPQPTADQA